MLKKTNMNPSTAVSDSPNDEMARSWGRFCDWILRIARTTGTHALLDVLTLDLDESRANHRVPDPKSDASNPYLGRKICVLGSRKRLLAKYGNPTVAIDHFDQPWQLRASVWATALPHTLKKCQKRTL